MCPASARASQSSWLRAHSQAFLSRLPGKGGSGHPQRPRNRADKICCTFFFFCLSVLFFCFPNVLQCTHSPVFSENKNQQLLGFFLRGYAKLRWLQQGPHILLSASEVTLDSSESKAFSDGLLLATDTPLPFLPHKKGSHVAFQP